MQFLGIEIGGTKLQLGVGSGDGSLKGFWRGAVDVGAGPEGIRKQIELAVPRLLCNSGIGKSQLSAVGIGFGGPVDDQRRTIIKSHQIVGWDDFPLADWLAELVGLPAVLGNDADVAGLAEALFGAGSGMSPVFYITVGSGIGGGLIINEQIVRGCGLGAAEFGHMRMPRLIRRGIEFLPLEEVASGWAIQQQAQSEVDLGKYPNSLLARGRPDSEKITASDVAQAAAQRDGLAGMILDQALSHLAEAICHVIALVCPRRVVIGGGVSLMGEELFFEPLRHKVAQRVFRPFAKCYEIVPAALGEEVVVHGALALAKRMAGHGSLATSASLLDG